MFYTDSSSCLTLATFQVLHSDISLLVTVLDSRHLHHLSAPFALFQWRAPCVCTTPMHLLKCVNIFNFNLYNAPVPGFCQMALSEWAPFFGVYLEGGEQAALQHWRWLEPSWCCYVYNPGAGPCCNLPSGPTVTPTLAEISREVPLIGTPLRQ